MEKTTKQGIRDLNSIVVNKKDLNGRKDKEQNNCAHIFDNCIDDGYKPFKRCQRCKFEFSDFDE